MVVMLQKEVARNMAAPPGERSVLSVAIQLYSKPQIMGYVSPRAFQPSPKVTSAILRIEPYPVPALALDSEDAFFRLVRAGFSAPRKQLRNSLSHALKIIPGKAENLLRQANIDPKQRAETLRLEEWGKLYQAYEESHGKASDPLRSCQDKPDPGGSGSP